MIHDNMKKNSLNKLVWNKRFTYLKNIPFNEQDLNCKGTKFQIVKFEPHTSLKPHYHKNTSEIFYIRSGTGILRLNRQEYRCQPDDFFLCEPGDVHEFENDTDKEFVVLIFKTNEAEDIHWV